MKITNLKAHTAGWLNYEGMIYKVTKSKVGVRKADGDERMFSATAVTKVELPPSSSASGSAVPQALSNPVLAQFAAAEKAKAEAACAQEAAKAAAEAEAAEAADDLFGLKKSDHDLY